VACSLELPKDLDFLWIAKEGLKAPLPQGWKPYHDDSDDLFFVNPSTGVIQSEHPLDEFYRNKFLNQKNKYGKLTHEEENPLVRINEEEES
jgi:centrosomal protein CEP164